MLDQASEVQRLAQIAMHGANRPLSIKRWSRSTMPFTPKSKIKPHGDSIKLERALIRTMHFQNSVNQTVLYLMREFHKTMAWKQLGYPSLTHWARVRLIGVANDDKINRLCNTIERVIAPLDADPVITADGEKITGLALIEHASSAALIRVSGAFASSTNGARNALAAGLMTGNSNDRQLKALTGWTPKTGLAPAQFKQVDDETVMITIRATPQQARSIETQIGWQLLIQMEDVL